VVEYNFYAHRAIEGYYETVGRANAGYTGFDYDLALLVDENGMLRTLPFAHGLEAFFAAAVVRRT